jgi:hypothetical protein
MKQRMPQLKDYRLWQMQHLNSLITYDMEFRSQNSVRRKGYVFLIHSGFWILTSVFFSLYTEVKYGKDTNEGK